jgi:hypothetical protein
LAIEDEVILMTKDGRNILEILQSELTFIEKGGYGRSVRTPWRAKSVFQDAPTCLNYAYLEKAHPCNRCHLIDFVPDNKRAEQVPCHFIPLSAAGETIDSLECADNQQKLERTLKAWLQAKIEGIKIVRFATQESGPGS